ncbi:hypothetical protein [Helicobacter zhangjianzhongii]|uniref:hypothetical protein n=1 Tax=Helicobacter zhangjianzhongii TaxID=2974574 RepID=UPI0025560E22|nr:hypothetical protein [Helicobacter sp. CPD2-1]MDL0080483.1 hypothetical protein [Helicobacter sp. CPD2-1]
MDRHTTASAVSHDDRKHILGKTRSARNRVFYPRTKAVGFADDFGGFQGAGAGIYLVDNEQARAVESTKSAAKPTPKEKRSLYANNHTTTKERIRQRAETTKR